jgi:hypothetical protein
MLTTGMDGKPRLVLGNFPDWPGAVNLYLWRANLPKGYSVERPLLRPIQMAEQPYFAELVELSTILVHTGQLVFDGTQMRAVAADGEAGVRARDLAAIVQLLEAAPDSDKGESEQ